jgi:hypothetical protein
MPEFSGVSNWFCVIIDENIRLFYIYRLLQEKLMEQRQNINDLRDESMQGIYERPTGYFDV